MQAQICRTPVGHYILNCSLAEEEGVVLPDHWTHIELDLGQLRILCALPEHPRQQDCTLADPRLSCWLRARVHAGKLAANQTVALHAIYEGVFCVETRTEAAQIPALDALPAEATALDSLSVEALPVDALSVDALPLESLPAEATALDALSVEALSVEALPENRPCPSVPTKLAPRPVRLTARQSARALAAKASA